MAAMTGLHDKISMCAPISCPLTTNWTSAMCWFSSKVDKCFRMFSSPGQGRFSMIWNVVLCLRKELRCSTLRQFHLLSHLSPWRDMLASEPLKQTAIERGRSSLGNSNKNTWEIERTLEYTLNLTFFSDRQAQPYQWTSCSIFAIDLQWICWLVISTFEIFARRVDKALIDFVFLYLIGLNFPFDKPRSFLWAGCRKHYVCTRAKRPI